MNSIFPQIKERNILLFYLLSITTSSLFMIGNWIFFWLRYMTYAQIGIVDASCFAFGMIMEVPTGAISDMLGKKKTMIASTACCFIGIFTMAFANSLLQIVIGFLIAQVGWALYSGAAEALAYDSLKEKGKEETFDHVITTSNMLGTITGVITTLIGIWLYTIYFRLPHIGWGVMYFIGFLLCFLLTEPRIDSEKFSLKAYINQLSQGAKQLIQPALKPFLILMFVLLGFYYMFSYGLVKPAMAEGFGWYATEQGYVFAGMSILGALLSRCIPWMRKKLSDMTGLIILTVLLGLGFIISAYVYGWWGIVPFMFITISGALNSPWVSVVVNREIPSQYRATTLSTIAMFIKVPYILTAVIAGEMIQQGHLRDFSLIVGIIIVGAIVVSSFFKHSGRRGISS